MRTTLRTVYRRVKSLSLHRRPTWRWTQYRNCICATRAAIAILTKYVVVFGDLFVALCLGFNNMRERPSDVDSSCRARYLWPRRHRFLAGSLNIDGRRLTVSLSLSRLRLDRSPPRHRVRNFSVLLFSYVSPLWNFGRERLHSIIKVSPDSCWVFLDSWN